MSETTTNRVREVASYFGAEMVICDKHRKRANEVASMTVIGDVSGRNVVLIDDICDTAGTLCKSAALLKERGALSVRAFCTHPVLSGKAYENIENSVLEKLVVCDTIPLKKNIPKIEVVPTAELFAVAIRNTSCPKRSTATSPRWAESQSIWARARRRSSSRGIPTRPPGSVKTTTRWTTCTGTCSPS